MRKKCRVAQTVLYNKRIARDVNTPKFKLFYSAIVVKPTWLKTKQNKSKKISLQTTIPQNLNNNEDTKRDIHRSNLHGN